MRQMAESEGTTMAESIIRTVIREATRAFKSGNFTFSAFRTMFGIEHVNGMEYRLVTAENSDAGIRFVNDHGNLRFFMA